MRTAWKVFRKGYYGRLISVVAYGKALIRYERGAKNYAPRWLRKKGYHPLVFKRKKDAVFFARYGGEDLIIEKVEIGKKVTLPPVCSTEGLGSGEIVTHHRLDKWPEGTMMVKWVKPLTEVEK